MSNFKTIESVPLEWTPGDIILELYEVRTVTDGFGDNVHEKVCHEGGFGRIYKVWHRRWRRELAVKSPHSQVFMSQEQKDTFIRECGVWVKLGLHPHIVSCQYVRELGGVPRIFSEYAPAGSLQEWLSSRWLYRGSSQEVLARILDVSIQFAWGLHAAHEEGVIHQDVKPLNALMWEDGSLKVCDFGLAGARQKVGLSETHETKRSIMVSSGGMTPSYCSPEQAAGGYCDRRTDIWSWAVSVLHMFSGEITWYAGYLAGEALESKLNDNNQHPDIPPIPGGVVDLLRTCFRSSPVDRPRTLNDCARILITLFEKETGRPYSRSVPNDISDSSATLNNRALSLIDLGRPDEAEIVLKRALSIDRFDLDCIYNYGLLRLKRWQNCETDFISSLYELSDHTRSGWRWRFLAAQAHLSLGEGETAANHLHGIEAPPDANAQVTELRTWARAKPQAGLKKLLDQCDSLQEGVVALHDSRCALLGSSDNTLRLVELATGRSLRRFTGHEREIQCVAVSPDRRYVLSASYDDTLRIWCIQTGKCIRVLQGVGIREFWITPDGLHALSLGVAGGWQQCGGTQLEIQLWGLETGDYQCITRASSYVDLRVALMPNGRHAISTQNHSLQIWDIYTGQCLHEVKLEWLCECIAVSPNGDLAFLSTNSKSAEIQIIDLNAYTVVDSLSGHSSCIKALALTTDGRHLVSADGQCLKLWNVERRDCLRTFLSKPRENFINIDATSDDNMLIRVSDNFSRTRVEIWSVEAYTSNEGQQFADYSYVEVPSAQQASTSEQLFEQNCADAESDLACGDYGQAVTHFEAARVVRGFHNHPRLTSIMALLSAGCKREAFRSWWCLKKVPAPYLTSCLVLAGDRGRAYSSGVSGFVEWDLVTNQKLKQFTDRDIGYSCMAVTPDARLALTVSDSEQGRMSIWDVDTGTRVRTLEGIMIDPSCLAVTPNGQYALCADNEMDCGGCIQVWDINAGACVRTLSAHKEGITCVAVSADSRLIYSGSQDNTVGIWDADSGRCVRKLKGHSLGVSSISLLPDGDTLASGARDGNVILWNVHTGQCLKTLRVAVPVLSGKLTDRKVFNVLTGVFPCGRYLVTSINHNNVTVPDELSLWDLTTSKRLASHQNNYFINSVAITPDGRNIILAGTDGILIWECDWQYVPSGDDR